MNVFPLKVVSAIVFLCFHLTAYGQAVDTQFMCRQNDIAIGYQYILIRKDTVRKQVDLDEMLSTLRSSNKKFIDSLSTEEYDKKTREELVRQYSLQNEIECIAKFSKRIDKVWVYKVKDKRGRITESGWIITRKNKAIYKYRDSWAAFD